MRRHGHETLTGLFVLATLAVVVGVVMALTAPGVVHKQNTYYVFFDNAGGIEPGIDVLLAGRHVGQVVSLRSPVPVAERPEGYKDLEALVEVRVTKNERIYNSVTVRMQPYGLLGLELIDFVNGDETSGLAPSGTKFVGSRVAGLNDATEQMTSRLAELKTSIENINELTAAGGDLSASAANARGFTAKIREQPWRLVWPTKKKHRKDTTETRGAKAERKAP
jgi:ABC-type transporter Mla subunit MlaD